MTDSGNRTKLEEAWDSPLIGTHLFKSEQHGVMAVADPFAKFHLHVVVAPREGDPGKDVRFSKLPLLTKRLLHEVADAVEEKIERHIEPEQRVITHTEGYGIPDHAHIVLFAAKRGEGKDLWVPRSAGELAIEHTLNAISFNPNEAEMLDQRLAQVARTF
jgi:hypothetical protein